MKNPLYLRQLKRDLNHWIELGLVDQANAEAILASAGSTRGGHSLAGTLTNLGVILLGFAALSFVAANFWAIPKLVQLTILLLSMWLSFGAAAWLLDRDRTGYGHAALLLGIALFGVNIMMIGQIYHISAHWPDGILTWGLGALLIALLIPSRAALAAAFVILGVWTGTESIGFEDPLHWPYLLLWGVMVVAVHRLGWGPGIHLAIVSLVFWLLTNSWQAAQLLNWGEGETVTFFALMWATAWAGSAVLASFRYEKARAIEVYSAGLFLIAFFLLFLVAPDEFGERPPSWMIAAGGVCVLGIGAALLAGFRKTLRAIDTAALILLTVSAALYPFFVENGEEPVQWLYRGFYLAGAVWAVGRGAYVDDKALTNIAFAALTAEILHIYFGTFATLLGGAAFFFVAGIGLIGLSFVLERIRRRLMAAAEDGNRP